MPDYKKEDPGKKYESNISKFQVLVPKKGHKPREKEKKNFVSTYQKLSFPKGIAQYKVDLSSDVSMSSQGQGSSKLVPPAIFGKPNGSSSTPSSSVNIPGISIEKNLATMQMTPEEEPTKKKISQHSVNYSKWDHPKSVQVNLVTENSSKSSKKLTWREKARSFQVNLKKEKDEKNNSLRMENKYSSMLNKSGHNSSFGRNTTFGGTKLHPALIPPRHRKKAGHKPNFEIMKKNKPVVMKTETDSIQHEVELEFQPSDARTVSRMSHAFSTRSARSTMTRGLSRQSQSKEKSLTRGSNVVDVKCINCGVYISEEKVSYHSKICGKVSTTIKYSQKLSKLTNIQGDLRSLRKVIGDSIKESTNDEDIHYFIKLREIVNDLLSIKKFDEKSLDLLKFITKDIIFLYETCEGNANTILYIERIAEICDTLTGEVELGERSTLLNYGRNQQPAPDQALKMSKVGSRTSSNSERLTLLNTKRNELISLKRKTLGMMNKLISKKPSEKSVSEYSNVKNLKEAPSVRFTQDYYQTGRNKSKDFSYTKDNSHF